MRRLMESGMTQTAPPRRPGSMRQPGSNPAPDISDLADAAGGPHPAHDEYDALTDLFLGEAPAARPAPAPHPATSLAEPAPAVCVEALVLGHLPVLASAWATQYARQRSVGLGGPVVLLKIRAGEATLDLVGRELA